MVDISPVTVPYSDGTPAVIAIGTFERMNVTLSVPAMTTTSNVVYLGVGPNVTPTNSVPIPVGTLSFPLGLISGTLYVTSNIASSGSPAKATVLVISELASPLNTA